MRVRGVLLKLWSPEKKRMDGVVLTVTQSSMGPRMIHQIFLFPFVAQHLRTRSGVGETWDEDECPTFMPYGRRMLACLQDQLSASPSPRRRDEGKRELLTSYYEIALQH